jgi:S1-C subfamily serine protease
MTSVTTPPKQRPVLGTLLAGLIGGLVVAVLGAVLIATDVIDVGDERTVVRESSISRPAAGSGDDGRTVADIYRKEGRGVVFIEARGVSDESPFGLPQRGARATGSGFVIDDEGHILTNAHVVEGSDDVSVRFGNGESVDAELKGSALSLDLAVLKVDPDETKLNPLPLGDSKDARVGDPVVAIGNPFGFEQTVTTGIVSALQRGIRAPNNFTISDAIQTDAAINPGNSGGPLLDAEGNVIGINSQIATGGGGGSVGIGFAVPVNAAKRALPQLKRGAEVKLAYIGVTTAEVPSQVADDLNLPQDSGALVQEVENGSPADKAGLRGGDTQVGGELVAGGDLIVKVDGREVRGPEDIGAAIADDQPGDRVRIEFFRGAKRRSLELELIERPRRAQAPQQQPGAPQSPDDVLPLP